MHVPNASLFRAYDVRGIVGDTLEAADFISIGHAFASHVSDTCQCRTPLIVVMRDGRDSSPNLAEAMIEGLLKAGAHVLDAGMGPTPMCYFATHHLDADGSVMITGSHNPPNHNGAKFMSDGHSLHGAELASLRDRVSSGNLLHSRGQREEVDLIDEYVFDLKKALGVTDALNKLPIAWDAGNGVAGMVVQHLIDGTLAEHIPLYLDVDSRFPNHHPDPSVAENLKDLEKACATAGIPGMAFDGDGDRLGVVDEKGRPVLPDHLLMLLADDVLKQTPGAAIIADVKISNEFFKRVADQGGEAVMWKTGHAHIKAKLAEIEAKFAGEASGHIFYGYPNPGYDDGMYAALRLMRIIYTSGKKLSELVDALPPLFTSPEKRISCPDDKKFSIIATLQKQFPDAIALDGVRVSTPDGWWLIRASNTQAALTTRAESTSSAGLVRVLHAMHQALAATDASLTAA